LLTEWITTDIQSAAAAPNVATTTPPGCSDDASLPATGVNVAQMTWTDRSTGDTYHAAYRTEQVNAGPPAVWYLVRYFCEQGQPSTHFPVVRGLKDGSVCAGGVPSTPPEGTCVLTATWPRFDLQIVSVANTQSYTFTATATGRSATSGTDTSGPNFVSAVAYNTDSSGNAGLVNRVVVTFDEALKTNDALPVSQWTLQNAPNGVTVTSAAAANHAVTLTLGNGTGSPVTSASNFKIDLQAANSVQDGLGNQAPPFTHTVDDGMLPELLGIKSHASVAGRLDQIVADFSESLQPSTDTGVWHLSTPVGWSSPPDVSNVSVNGSQVTLTIDSTTVPAAPDTAAPGMTATLDPSVATGIRDSAGNPAAFSGNLVTDAMAPLLTSVAFSGGTQSGLFETGDVLVATFSEPLVAASTTPTVTLDQPVGATTATIDIPGLTNGAIDTLSSSYFDSDGNRAQWPASVVRLGNKITVTLTGPCVGTVTDPTCANLRVGTFVDTPLDLPTTITDRAPIPNVALDVTLNIRWF
jgi:hypothetical protein